MKTIVLSAVNIRKGGTLTILRSCLDYLSTQAQQQDWRIVALVHKRSLCDYPNIEYIEMPHTIKGWGRRLWCEYVTMKQVSERFPSIDLWLSMHDTTPRVTAKRQAVYCQTSFPFLKWRWRDFLFDPKIVLFALFTRFAYRINIHRNKFLIVQAEWLRRGFSQMFGIEESRFIVAPPQKEQVTPINAGRSEKDNVRFFFAATPDCHKNFEAVCRAAEMLAEEADASQFEVAITLKGDENRYAKWLYSKWESCKNIKFVGFLSKEQLAHFYATSDCLIFPSRVETWGLPITEFAAYGKPMLLADLPYAHETAAGSDEVAFFDPECPQTLADKMRKVIARDYSSFHPVPSARIAAPVATDWHELFAVLLA